MYIAKKVHVIVHLYNIMRIYAKWRCKFSTLTCSCRRSGVLCGHLPWKGGGVMCSACAFSANDIDKFA